MAEERDEKTDEQRFVDDLVKRGEAAEADENGKLPPGATHEIVEKREDGSVRVERRRFSIS
jgi:hypothetical protein